MIDLNTKASTQSFIDVLREEIDALERLEAKGQSTADTCEMLVDLHEFLDRLGSMYIAYLTHAHRTTH